LILSKAVNYLDCMVVEPIAVAAFPMAPTDFLVV
jgi:hypothetical protein